MLKKIVKVRSLGARPVYDLEVPNNHNFLLKNGSVAHNCSHATAYVTLSYACLWLKHYYPLEWWVSVLQNSTKEEINEKFWKHCGHLILLPDILKSGSDWQIEGDKIRAPISMLFGMGETAHKQLSYGLPYTDLRSFCQAIVNYQKANQETKEKEVKGELKKVTTWGKNALTISKIQSMIIAGCMDSFFPPDTSGIEKLDAYHEMMKELYLKEGKKYNKSKKKMPQLDALGRYQAKKAILPPYGEDLRVILIKNGIIPEYLQVDGRYMRIHGNTTDRNGMHEDRWDPVVSGERLSVWETEESEKGIRCGIVAYIEDRETFQYANKSKTALKFKIEVGGQKMELVCWPDNCNKIPSYAKDIQKGAIVAAVIAKSPKRPGFSARDMMVIREPLGEDVDNSKEEG